MFMNLLFVLLFHMFPARDTELKVVFTDIKDARGQVYIAVYDSPSNYLSYDQDKIRTRRVLDVSSNGSISCSFPELPAGTYAITSFHDVNGNGKLDTNLLGVPTEPYGTSNNPRPKFRAPRWEEARFEWNPKKPSITIRLLKW